jgi:glutamine amidotransferase
MAQRGTRWLRPVKRGRMAPVCRALLYLGQPVLLDNLLFQPDSALVRQSYMPKMLHMLNLAGFGMRAWDPASR